MTVTEDSPDPVAWDVPSEQMTPLARMRHWIAATVTGLDRPHLDSVLLVVTELVTNAYDHASGPRRVRLHRTGSPPQIRIEVEDTSPESPVPGRSRLGSDRGRGLTLISRISHAWGSQPRPGGGKTVWAVIACTDLS